MYTSYQVLFQQYRLRQAPRVPESADDAAVRSQADADWLAAATHRRVIDEPLAQLQLWMWDDNELQETYDTNTRAILTKNFQAEIQKIKRKPASSYIHYDQETEDGDGLTIYSHAQLLATYADWHFFEAEKDAKTGEVKMVQKSFINWWVQWGEKDEFDRIVFKPAFDHTAREVNLWRRPLAYGLTPINNEAKVHELVRPVIYHIYAVLANEDKVVAFMRE
jgi:hypothetical protein